MFVGIGFWALQLLGTFLPELMLQCPAPYSSSKSGQTPLLAPRLCIWVLAASKGLGSEGVTGARGDPENAVTGAAVGSAAQWPPHHSLVQGHEAGSSRLLSIFWWLSSSEFGFPLMLLPNLLSFNQGWGTFLQSRAM